MTTFEQIIRSGMMRIGILQPHERLSDHAYSMVKHMNNKGLGLIEILLILALIVILILAITAAG